MHIESPVSPPADPHAGPWYKELTRYHWFVFVVCAVGWLADCMDQQLFNLARAPAIEELRGTTEDNSFYAGLATMIFMFGWATGGIIFGIMGDRFGRAKTMLLTIFMYSLLTGLSALSVGFYDFAFYRFLTGLGVGGEFAVGVSFLAEVMPDRARSHALGWLQATSTIGNVSANFIGLALAALEKGGNLRWNPWRYEFLIGALPALMIVVVGRRLKEPERWRTMRANLKPGQKIGSVVEMLTTPLLRRNAICGLLLATSGVVGLWAIAFFGFDLTGRVLREPFKEEIHARFEKEAPASELDAPEKKARQEREDQELKSMLTRWTSFYGLMLNVGAFFGIYAFSKFAHRTGRKPAFAVTFIMALITTALTFLYLGRFAGVADIFWMAPLMGFFQFALFGGYAIYLPELFPTRLRSTGTSFCYNVGRYLAAFGPLMLGTLADGIFGKYGQVDSLRYAGVAMSAFFLLGLAVLPFAPETKGKPLPE